ncbi:hypothetical protein ARMGADRAFT_1029546 [Armillaria gallica]|uniref:Alpha-type protein kinase domain-containing protein n=1 Tax=Armillaria gallica TaxID=47427 RepID=A0A2H3DZD4_ARMGA|nr:hypothetical protein ARMGADRAFT_1029546 [Armillaria gallica]
MGTSFLGTNWQTIFIIGMLGKSIPIYVDMDRTTVMDVLVEVMYHKGTYSTAEDTAYDLFVLAGGGALPRTAHLSRLAFTGSTQLALCWWVRGESGQAGPSQYQDLSESWYWHGADSAEDKDLDETDTDSTPVFYQHVERSCGVAKELREKHWIATGEWQEYCNIIMHVNGNKQMKEILVCGDAFNMLKQRTVRVKTAIHESVRQPTSHHARSPVTMDQDAGPFNCFEKQTYGMPHIGLIACGMTNVNKADATPDAWRAVAMPKGHPGDPRATAKGYNVNHICHASETEKYGKLAASIQQQETMTVVVDMLVMRTKKTVEPYWKNMCEGISVSVVCKQIDLERILHKDYLWRVPGVSKGYNWDFTQFILHDKKQARIQNSNNWVYPQGQIKFGFHVPLDYMLEFKEWWEVNVLKEPRQQDSNQSSSPVKYLPAQKGRGKAKVTPKSSPVQPRGKHPLHIHPELTNDDNELPAIVIAGLHREDVDPQVHLVTDHHGRIQTNPAKSHVFITLLYENDTILEQRNKDGQGHDSADRMQRLNNYDEVGLFTFMMPTSMVVTRPGNGTLELVQTALWGQTTHHPEQPEVSFDVVDEKELTAGLRWAGSFKGSGKSGTSSGRLEHELMQLQESKKTSTVEYDASLFGTLIEHSTNSQNCGTGSLEVPNNGDMVPSQLLGVVCYKWPFVQGTADEVEPNSEGSYKKFTKVAETKAIEKEATCTRWCDTILKFSYEWIHHFVKKKGSAPPWTILEFRFAEMAIVQTIKGNFAKYVWNGNSSAYEALQNGEEIECAEFLIMSSFTVVFILDFQSVGLVLTDSQVMTSPNVTTGNTDMFEEGNIPDAFDGFPKDHCCNKCLTKFVGAKMSTKYFPFFVRGSLAIFTYPANSRKPKNIAAMHDYPFGALFPSENRLLWRWNMPSNLCIWIIIASFQSSTECILCFNKSDIDTVRPLDTHSYTGSFIQDRY